MVQQADVCIICALKEEANAVEQAACEQCSATFVTRTTDDDRFAYRSTTITNTRGESLTLVLLCQARPGPVSAAFDVGTLLEKFRPCFVGMSGVCAGDRRQVRIGDLVVAEYAYHFEEGKVTQDEQGRVLHRAEGITYGPAEHVLQRVRTFGEWEAPVAELKKRLFGTDELPGCVITLMASGMAVRSDDPFEMVQRQHRKTWALDMEAASLYLALRATPLVNGLVVKGVVDYADLAKDDTFHDFAARASAIYLLTFIQEYVTTNALLQRRSPLLSSTTRENRTRVLRRVRAAWIEGSLTQSLHQAARIELHLQDRPDVLVNPWRLQVQELDRVSKSLPDGTSIVDVYDRTEGALLILGEPGAGKTTLLLELTVALLERAKEDERLHMPIVFNLSSWAEKRQSLPMWLVEEMWMKYQVPRRIGQGWIDADHVLPLLDGLDEVTKDARGACVQHINDYYQARLERGSSPIVVCCRSEEYAALSLPLMLQHAVSILPLTDSQINTYLEQAGEQVKGLRRALEEDTELHNLACQPLMLNIFTLAYQGVKSVEIPTEATSEKARQTIFARYVERMLKRRGQSKRWNPEQVICWLTFMARQMQQHNQTVFYIERLQPDWLILPQLRIFYRILVPLVIGLIYGLSFEPIGGPVFGLAGALSGGFFFGLVRNIEPAEIISWSWTYLRQNRNYGLIYGLVSGLIFGLICGLVHGPIGGPLSVKLYSGNQINKLLGGLNAGLVAGLIFGQARRKMRIPIVISWSWGSRHQNLVHGLIYGLVSGLLNGLVSGLLFEKSSALSHGLVQGLAYGLTGALFVVMIGGLSYDSLDEREHTTPNEGIRRSVRRGTFSALIWGLIGSILTIAHGWSALAVGLTSAMTGWLFFGGTTCIQHFILRGFLWLSGSIPPDYVRFLDYAVECILLRKVGGGYIFMHRLLQDYFISEEKPDDLCKPSNPVSHVMRNEMKASKQTMRRNRRSQRGTVLRKASGKRATNRILSIKKLSQAGQIRDANDQAVFLKRQAASTRTRTFLGGRRGGKSRRKRRDAKGTKASRGAP